ncbi:hypothetical protein [Pontibacter sp. HSC-36F09]|uniref:hypothetical protein n=1 Tax=Pontibacter sp. HSC-36F09 TaxID=2910966 RepID=UPI00209E2FFE|nr:hypothetical protein [Pontibacter sp. HSC-36F09]MCP2043091.1 hypothetical protein [Pontibacter sp. HSC-36F09]
MRKSLITICSAFFFISGCNDNKQLTTESVEQAPIVEEKQLSILNYKTDFKFSDLDSFAIDSFNWENRIGQYKELDSTNFKLVWQKSDRVFNGTDYDRDYFYSWQNRNPNLMEFTVLTQDESSYCDLLHYLIYDKNGKAIDSFVAAAGCGDGGWGLYSYGKFISEDTYEEIMVETEMVEIDSVTNTEVVEGDSTVTHYLIATDGRVTKKEISKTPIRRIYN